MKTKEIIRERGWTNREQNKQRNKHIKEFQF
jgi:hypothetical protein